MTAKTKCTCGKFFLNERGNPLSKIAIIIDKPSFIDVKNGQLLSDDVGNALSVELSRKGIQDTQCCITSLWRHGYPGKETPCDRAEHENHALKILKDRRLILMLGTEVLDVFTGYSADEATGTIVKSKLLPKAIIVAGPSVATLPRVPIGEFRGAVELFAEHYRKIQYKGE